MKPLPAFLRLFYILPFAGLVTLSAQVTQIWGNGTGTWDTTTANWSGAVWTNGNNATIGATAARTGTITISGGGVTVNNVVSGSGGGAAYVHTLTGGPITLNGPASTWTMGGPTGSQVIVNSVISGSSSLEKMGTRLLILAGNNTYSGGTTITAGQLQIGNGGTTGSVTGNITANGALNFNRSDTYAYGGVISGASAVTQAGSGTLILTGNNLNTGNTNINAGLLQLGDGGTSGTVGGNINNNTALTFNRSDTHTYGGVISGTGTVTIGGTGTVLLSGANTYTGTTTVSSGAALGGTGSLTSAVSVAGGGTIVGAAGGVFTTSDLGFSAGSNLNVALGAPSSTGLFHVNGNLTLDGTLNITDTGGFGPGLYRLFDYTGALTDNGLVFGLTGGASASSLAIQTTTANQVNLYFDAGPANIWRGGAGTWNADAGGSGWTDIVGILNNPWTTSQFAIFTGVPGTVTIDTAAGAVGASGLQFAVDGYTVAGSALTNNTAGAVFRVGNGTGAGAAMSATISAPIIGTGGIDKTDLGTLVLSGTNTYSGDTTVSNGTLHLTGNQSGATGVVTVANGAILGGSGTTGGVVTVAGGGTLVGQSGQTLTMAGLILGGTSQLNVSLGAPSATGLFQVNGNLTLDGTLNVTDAGAFGEGVYRLIDYTGALTNNTLALGTAPVGTQFLAVQTSVANQVNLVFDAGPRNFWRGGSGTWTADAGSNAWSEFTYNAATFWTPQFAIFQTSPGTVTIDTAAGTVIATGAQFAVDGYTVTGGTLTNNTAAAVFRVGDGSGAGAAMTATISAPITGTGGIDKTDLGTLVLSGTNTYAGTTTVTGGTLRIDGNQAGVAGATTVRTGGTLGGVGTLGGAVTVENGGILAGQNGQTLTMNALTLNPTAGVNVTLGAPSTTTIFQVNGNLTLDGTLNIASGAGFGPGAYRLINYTGTLTDNGLVFGTTPIGTQYLNVQTSVANQVNFIFNAGAANFWSGGSGFWTANPAGTAWTDFGNFSAVAWTPQFAIFQGAPGTVTIDPSAGAVVATGAQFAVNGYSVAGGALTNNTPGAIFRVGDGSGAGAAMRATISAPITGTGGIEKTDLGTLVLSGTNTYAGATTVTNGTLRVDGNQSGATGAVTVRPAATLTGMGILGGAVTVENGGTLVGQSGGTLTTGALTLSPTANVAVSLGAPSATALFQVNGNLTLDGTLNVASAPGFGPGLYRLFNYTGALTDNGLVFGSTAGVSANSFALQTSILNQINLLYQDLVTPLPIWTGGSGVWTGNPAGSGFGEASGAVSGGWRPGLAIFQGTPGTVTVDSSTGTVEVYGIQFASSGYIINGGVLTIHTPNIPFRVGDGTSAGAAMTATINASLAGGGGVYKTDLGTLILGGNNTYTGPTAIIGGTLQISSDGNLGAGNAGLTLNGGTLRTTASMATGRAVSLEGTGGTFDTGANTLTLSGAVTGAGPLTKTGTGQLTLSGATTHNGATTIAAGTLFLNNASTSATAVAANATLAGNGAIRGNLANLGRLSPGTSPGTITVGGNFTQGATGSYAAEIASATAYDKVVVTGSASLGGSLVVSGLNGFVPQVDQNFVVLTAAGGVTGTFASVTSPWDQAFAMLRFQPLYTSNAVTLAMTQRPFAGLSGTSNQIALGGAVDGAITLAAIPNLRTALNVQPTEAGVLAAMSELSPRRYERWFEQAVYSAGSTLRSVENRLADTRLQPQTGLWLELVRRESRFDAEAESLRAEGNATGLVLGGDTRVTPDLWMGLLFSYTDEELTLDTAGSLTTTERFAGALYARYNSSRLDVEATGGLGRGNLVSRRTVAVPGYMRVAAGETGSYEAFLNLRVSYPLTLERTSLTPYAAVKFLKWQANGFDETEAGEANLALEAQSANSLSSRVGFTASRSFSSQRGTRFTPRLDVAWRNEFRNDARDLTAALGGSEFTVRTRHHASSGLVAGLGLDAALGERFAAYARLAAEWSTSVDEALEARAGLTYRF